MSRQRGMMGWIIRRNRFIFLITLFVALFHSALGVFTVFGLAFLLQQVVDFNRDGFLLWTFILLAVEILLFSSRFADIYLKTKFRERIELDIREETYNSLISKWEFSTARDPSKFLSWLDGDVVKMRDSIEQIIGIVVLIATIILRMSLLLYFSWIVALISLISFLILLIFPIILKRTFIKIGREMAIANQEDVSKSESFFKGYIVFLHANKRVSYLDFIKRIQQRLQKNIDRQKLKLNLSYLVFNFGGMALQIIGDVLVGILILFGYVPAATFIASSTYLGSNMASSIYINEGFININSTKPLFNRLVKVSREEISQERSKLPKFKQLSLENVSFSYQKGAEEVKVIEGLNLTFLSSNRYAIVGPSGSGKSTLLRLLVTLLKPTKGLVAYNGEDLSSYHPSVLSQKFGVIVGSWGIFKASLKDNLTLFDNCFSDSELKDVLKRVNLGELDLEAEVDNKSLSSGQIQRIAIARWLLRPTEILLLDEAFSNIDGINLNLIRQEIFKRKDLTVIEVTHHLDSKQKYDKVISIEELVR